MTREDLEPIAEIVKEKDLYVISDKFMQNLLMDRITVLSLLFQE